MPKCPVDHMLSIWVTVARGKYMTSVKYKMAALPQFW